MRVFVFTTPVVAERSLLKLLGLDFTSPQLCKMPRTSSVSVMLVNVSQLNLTHLLHSSIQFLSKGDDDLEGNGDVDPGTDADGDDGGVELDREPGGIAAVKAT
jgi:hypothetical protein